jgi:manganese efflux pump family protein
MLLQSTVIAFSLSSDAFAASIAKGARFSALSWNRSLCIALGFGCFEALAPLFGYLLGQQFASVIEHVDHWIALVLLGFLGGRMVWRSYREQDAGEPADSAPGWGSVFLTALGTSVDATIVGVTLALVSDNIPLTLFIIGVVTFFMTLIGLRLGGVIGERAGKWAEFLGGVGLAAIGLNIFVSHTMF